MINKETLNEMAKTLNGMPVLGCLEGSSAAQAGVRYGDILLSVNGQRVHDATGYVEAKALSKDGMDIVLFRDGKEMSLRVDYDKEAGPVNPMSLVTQLAGMNLINTDPTTAPKPDKHGNN